MLISELRSPKTTICRISSLLYRIHRFLCDKPRKHFWVAQCQKKEIRKMLRWKFQVDRSNKERYLKFWL